MPTTALLAAASAVPGPQQPVVVAASVFTSLFNQHPKDKARIQAAQDALTRALAGDPTALPYMQAQAVGSATQTGKDAFKAALAAYAAQRPTFPIQTSPLKQQVDTTVGNVLSDIANGVQNIGAGATTALANKISPDSGAVTLPLSKNQLVPLAVLAALILFLRR